MKNLTIFTDPHLGTNRAAHTTRTSSQNLKQALYHQAMSIVSAAQNPVFCAGDLFDKAFNPEAVLVQGYNVASRCWQTLAGNHDETNREGTVTSLRALQDMGVAVCSVPDLSTPFYEAFESIYLVPHHASQELFETAMFRAAEHAAQTREGLASYLFLHCNYDIGFEITDNTLNLTSEVAERLLNAFDFIFIGHEHNPSTHLDGRVVILGNTHPTSFADISDKFVYHLELDTAELTKELIYSKDAHYLQLTLGDPIPDLTGIHWVDVTGRGTAADSGAVNDYLNQIWKASFYQPEGEEGMETELFGVRNKVALQDSLQGTSTDIGLTEVVSLQDRIRKDLKDSDLASLYEELLADALA